MRWIGYGGEDGIRTHETLLESTPLAGERLRPLGHLSVTALDKEKPRHNQLAIGQSYGVVAVLPIRHSSPVILKPYRFALDSVIPCPKRLESSGGKPARHLQG